MPLFHSSLAHPGIRVVLVFGSPSHSNVRAGSDVDLMMIGTISVRQLGKLLSGVYDKTGAPDQPHVLTPVGLVKRRKTRGHFVTTVLSEPRLFVIGTADELKAIGR